MVRAGVTLVALALLGACDVSAAPADATAGPDADPAGCPAEGLRGSGRHRLFVQGHQGTPRSDGRYPLLHEAAPDGGDAALCDDSTFVVDSDGDGVWQPGEAPRPLGPAALRHGEHFLVGAGAFAEFAIPLCADLGAETSFYIPNYDEPGSRALHQLVVLAADGGETVIAEAIDEEAGQSGYNPFVRQPAGVDPATGPGDLLLLRTTNLSGVPFSVMVWLPPSEYESWILVEVR